MGNTSSSRLEADEINNNNISHLKSSKHSNTKKLKNASKSQRSSSRAKAENNNNYNNNTGYIKPSKHGAKKVKNASSKSHRSSVKSQKSPKGSILSPKRKKKDYAKKKTCPSTPLLHPEQTEGDVPTSSSMRFFEEDEIMHSSFTPTRNRSKNDRESHVSLTPSTAVSSGSNLIDDDEKTKITLHAQSSFSTDCEGSFSMNSLDTIGLSPSSNFSDPLGSIDLAPLNTHSDDAALVVSTLNAPDSPIARLDEEEFIIPPLSISSLNPFPSSDDKMDMSSQDKPCPDPNPPIPRRLTYICEASDSLPSPSAESKKSFASNLDEAEALPNDYHTNGLGGGGGDQDSLMSMSKSLQSSYSNDLESIGNNSTGTALSDLSLSSSIASLNLKRKKRRSPPQLLKDSRLSNRNLSGTKKRRRPTATDAFETLPRHLIKSALVRQATSTLRDERFVQRRIVKLGPVKAAKIHVSDLLYLQQRDVKDSQRREALGDDARMPSASTFRDGDSAMGVTLESFDLFVKCILGLCSIQVMDLVFDCELLNGDTADGDGSVATQEDKPKAPTIATSDAGKAIYLLGKCVNGKDFNEEAMAYYRTALFLFLSELEIREPCLLDESGDCTGFFYVRIANEVIDVYSPTQKDIATLLTKMGDIHGKNNEVNDALHCYRASQVFWTRYLSEKRITSVKDCECVADMDELDDHAAAVEGLALAHNRIGGVYCAKGDLRIALKSFNEAMEMQLKALGRDHLEVAKTLHNIGVTHRHNKDLDLALEFYHKALRIFELNLGKENLDTARTLHNIGGVYRRQHKYDKAMTCFRDVLKVRQTLLGDCHPSVSITLVSIAAVLRRSGKKEEANKYYSKALK